MPTRSEGTNAGFSPRFDALSGLREGRGFNPAGIAAPALCWALGIAEECWLGCCGERLAGDLVLPKPGEYTQPFARGRVRNSTTTKEQLTEPCQRPLFLPS